MLTCIFNLSEISTTDNTNCNNTDNDTGSSSDNGKNSDNNNNKSRYADTEKRSTL